MLGNHGGVRSWATGIPYRALRLRHDWWFRWAHDPLCDRLGAGVLKIGKLRLCRGCVGLYTGLATGTAISLTAPVVAIASAPVAPAVWLGAASTTTAMSIPSAYGNLSRGAKDGVRFSTGALGGLLVAFARSRRWNVVAAFTAAVVAAYRIITLARARKKATACNGCPELAGAGVCSGYAQQAVSLRAYEHAASERATRARLRRQPSS